MKRWSKTSCWGVQLGKRLALNDTQLMAYHQAMAAAEGQYQAMRSKSYTVLTEGDKHDRMVHCGETRTGFSKVCGDDYDPIEGLALQRWDTTTYKALR